MACVAGVQREGEEKTRGAKRDRREEIITFPVPSPDSASRFKFPHLPPFEPRPRRLLVLR